MFQLSFDSSLGTDSPTHAGGNAPGTGPAGPDLLSHLNPYQSNNQSFNTDSPNLTSSYNDSPVFPPAAPTPPSFVQPQYLPGPMHPIGTGRDASTNDGRTANLLSLLKNTGPSSQLGAQPTAQDPAISIPRLPIPPSVIHAPAPVAADPSGLLAALMRGEPAVRVEGRERSRAGIRYRCRCCCCPRCCPLPLLLPRHGTRGPRRMITKQYLLNLLNRPKPSQEKAIREPPLAIEHFEQPW